MSIMTMALRMLSSFNSRRHPQLIPQVSSLAYLTASLRLRHAYPR